MTKRTIRIVMMLLLLLLIAQGCGGVENQSLNKQNENVEEPPLLEEPELEPEEPEEPITFPYAFPLTGLGADVELTSRPIVVMVENSPKARPQSGLDQADIVYEILAEGEITRFVAVYQSESPEVIGPVRSIRPYFVEIGDQLDGLVVHAGWSPDAKKMLTNRKVQHFDAVYGDHPFFWRSSERVAPHNLYTSIDLILQGAEAKRFRTDEWDNPGIIFDAAELAGEPVQKVTIPYLHGYVAAYEYDADSGRYGRIMAGEEHVDKENGEQLQADNIIIARTSHRVLDQAGRRHVDVNGPGEGYYLRDGQMVEITWEQTGGTIRMFQDDKELARKPGNTWIQFVPINSAVSFE